MFEGHEGAVFEFGRGGEAAVVVGQVGVCDEAVCGFDRCDPRQRQFLDEAVLEGAEGALGAAARLGRIGGDVLDAELVEGAADLGVLILGDLAACLGGVEVVAAAVGIEAAGQPLVGEHLLQRAEGGRGAFLLDQEGRIDLAGGVVHGDDQVARHLAGHPVEHLQTFAGILQADAYAGYRRLYAAGRSPGPVIEALCWSHGRRKFYELADIAANKRRGKRAPPISPLALEAVKRIDALFDIEREINGETAERRLAVRRERSAPLVAELEDWMRMERAGLSRHASAAKAMD